MSQNEEFQAIKTETMADFEEEITRSFKRLQEGDLLRVTVIDVREDAIMVDLGTYTEGIIPASEVSADPRFSIFSDIHVGDQFMCMVLREDDGNGNVLLSKKQASELLAWDQLKEAMDKGTTYKVTIQSVVNGGVVTYLEGIRGFIPASQLSLSYVENLEEWVNKTLDVAIITVDAEKKKLVLSAKILAQKEAEKNHRDKLSKVQKGVVTTGIVENIAPYGAFVRIGDGLTGLVHISKMANKRIKSPSEVVKVGDEVTVKIVDVHDGKISLDMKAVLEEDAVDDVHEVAIEYVSDEEASTNLGNLLSKFKL